MGLGKPVIVRGRTCFHGAMESFLKLHRPKFDAREQPSPSAVKLDFWDVAINSGCDFKDRNQRSPLKMRLHNERQEFFDVFLRL